MPIGERTKSILEAVIKEFAKTGSPVSSSRLYENYDFGIRPARIRSELNSLVKLGYLDRPHTSAGRVPTNKGYVFFVKEFSPSGDDTDYSGKLEEIIGRDFDLETAVKRFGSLFCGFRMGWEEAGEVYKAGLDDLFSAAEEDWSLAEIRAVLGAIEDVEARRDFIDDLIRDSGEEVRVFIGRNNPIVKSDKVSVIAVSCKSKPVDFLLLGSKRMDYEKNISLMKELRGFIENHG